MRERISKVYELRENRAFLVITGRTPRIEPTDRVRELVGEQELIAMQPRICRKASDIMDRPRTSRRCSRGLARRSGRLYG